MTPQKSKSAPKAEGPKGKLNRAYRYGEAHVATVALVSLGLGVVLALFGAYSFFHEQAIERRVTKVESPCNVHPAGKECQSIKQRSDEKRSVASACVLAYKLDKDGQLLRLTRCPVEPGRQKKVEDAERKSGKGPIAAAEAAQGGDASDAQPGSSQPGRPEGGSGTGDQADQPHRHHQAPVSGEQGSGGADVPPVAPTAPPASTSSQSSSSQTTERVESTVVETSPEAPTPVGKAVGGVVEGAGKTLAPTEEAVGGTVETVTGKACESTGLLCPK